jgi:hypothetical protein
LETTGALGDGAPLTPPGGAAAAIIRPVSPLRVLVAEDNVVNQRLIGRLLEKAGHVPTIVCDGRAALEALARDRFDLVLMDVQMPGMDGLQATRTIRAREAVTGAHLPIIALTAHAMKGDRERCLAAGMDDYLSKPLDPTTLRQTIARLTGDTGRVVTTRPELVRLGTA